MKQKVPRPQSVSQNDDFVQEPVNRYGEKGKIFTLTTGWIFKKTTEYIGDVNPNYTLFTKN